MARVHKCLTKLIAAKHGIGVSCELFKMRQIDKNPKLLCEKNCVVNIGQDTSKKNHAPLKFPFN